MRSAAAIVAASFGMLLAACAPDRPVASQVSETAAPVVDVEQPRTFPSHAGTPGNEVRDAREAAEEAARKIADATANAASRIREVGMEAVQAIQSAKSPDEPVPTDAEVVDASVASSATGAVASGN